MKNKLSDLRNHLFATLESLTEAHGDSLKMPIEIERAKAVSEVAQTIINSAKLELQYLELAGGENLKSEFLDTKPAPALIADKQTIQRNGNGHDRKGLSTGKNLGAGQ